MKSKSGSRDGICALCRAPGFLCESHLLPRFIIDPLRNQKSQVYWFDRRESAARASHRQVRQRLLCRNCDNIKIGQKENTLAEPYKAWLAAPNREAACRAVGDLSTKWAALKFVVISVFWRLSVADLRETKSLKFTQADEESLRLWLLDGPKACSSRWEVSILFIEPWDVRDGVDTAEVHKEEPLSAYWMAAGILWGLHKNPKPATNIIGPGFAEPVPCRHALTLPGIKEYAAMDRSRLRTMKPNSAPVH